MVDLVGVDLVGGHLNSRALDEVTENVGELDRRPQSHGVLEVTRRVWVVCSS